MTVNEAASSSEGIYLYETDDELAKDKKTVTVSFRLPKYMVDVLLQESELRGSTPSIVLRNVLGKHLNWDRYRLQMNMVPVPECFVTESLKRLSRKDVGDIAARCAHSFSGLTFLKMRRVGLESTLVTMEEWFKDASISYRRGFVDDYNAFVIQHNLDVNWSLFVSNLFTTVCGNLENVDYKVELSRDGKMLVLFARNKWRATQAQA